LSHRNAIDRIKGILKRKRPSVYKEWKKKLFNINHLFSFKTKHIHNVCTLLHISACCGLENIVKVLLQMGAEVNAIDHKYQETSLHRVASHTNITNLLVRGAGVDFMHKSGRTPLHLAAENGHTSIVEVLLTKGAHVNAVDRDRAIPLHFATKNGHKNIVKTLLENGASVNCIYRSGKTSLHLAAESGHTNIVKVLLENGAEVNYVDIDEKTPLHLAVENVHIKVVKALLQKGANPSLKDKDDYTAKDLARNNSIKRLLEKAEKKQRLKPIIIIGIATSVAITFEATLAVSHFKTGDVLDGIAFIMMTIITVLAFCVLSYNRACKPNTRVNEAHAEERHNAEVSVV
jgi:ankyrin repeat protein